MGEHGPERIVLDATDEGRVSAEARHTHDGIGRGASGDLYRRPHGIVDLGSMRFIDQRHRPLAHRMLKQEIVIGAGDHVDNRIAEAEDVIAHGGHEGLAAVERGKLRKKGRAL